MKKIFLFSIFAISLIFKCQAQSYEVFNISERPGKPLEPGFFYSLPQTVLYIDLKVSKTEYFRGPYADYAERLLGLKNVVYENKTVYQIEDVRVRTGSERNPNLNFFVQPNNSDIKLSFYSGYVLQGVNCEERLITTASAPVSDFDKVEKHADISGLFQKFVDLNLYEQVDTVLSRVKKDTIYVEEKTVKTKTVEKTPQKKAEDLAEQLTKLKENRMNLLTGFQEVNYDPKSLEYMNTELQNQEDEYIRLFTGVTRKNSDIVSFELRPKKTDNQNGNGYTYTICRISSQKGIVDTLADGEDIVVSIIPLNETAKIAEFYKKNRNQESKQKTGFYYQIPEQSTVDVTLKNKTIKSNIVRINQFGIIQTLPANINSFRLSPESGEIEQIYDLPKGKR